MLKEEKPMPDENNNGKAPPTVNRHSPRWKRPPAALNGRLPTTDKRLPPTHQPAINRRLPKGENLPHYAIEYFNQLVAQYVTLPKADESAQNSNAKAVAEGLIREQEEQKAEQERRGTRWPWERRKHYLNWGDVSGMEMALLQLLPEAYLQRYAWNLRARYHEVAGQCWYDFYQQSKPPNETAPPKGEGTAAVSVTTIPLGASGFFLLTPTAPQPPPADLPCGSPESAELRADLSILLSDLQRLRSTIKAREEKHSLISLIGALLAAVSLTLALGFYGGPSFYAEWTAKHSAPIASLAPPAKPAVPTNPKPAALGAHDVAPTARPAGPAAAGTPPLAAAPPAPVSSPLRILQMSALVILCGVLGGLISMLRRLQALPPGSTPLFDTIALNAGQLGIGLAPIYGGIFAMVLYLVFLSGILDTVIASTAGNTVFPRFSDATPKATSDYAKLLVWAFIAGFAEQLVPDVLNRLTARNTAALTKGTGAKETGASGMAPPARPA